MRNNFVDKIIRWFLQSLKVHGRLPGNGLGTGNQVQKEQPDRTFALFRGIVNLAVPVD